MIREASAEPKATNLQPPAPAMDRELREARQGHRAAVLWLTGLSGAGKSTLARALDARLSARGCRTMLLDGDHLRHGLCCDLGFSAKDRSENIRRAGEVAKLFFETGHLVLCTFISPFAEDRAGVRARFPEGRFVEVHVAAGLEACIARDPHGLYVRAQRGEIPDFTGISSPYEAPDAPEWVADTERLSPEALVDRLLRELERRELIPEEQP